MEPIFSEEQLQNMSKKNIIALMQAMQAHQKKQENKILTTGNFYPYALSI